MPPESPWPPEPERPRDARDTPGPTDRETTPPSETETAREASRAASSRRILARVAYDGTALHGWQVQPDGVRTVAGEITTAIALAWGEQVQVDGASRTDAGVHALGQAAAFSTRCRVPTSRLTRVLNAFLPSDIRLLACREVEPDFVPRFRARGKLYRYTIARAEVASPFWSAWALRVGGSLDLEAMRAAGAQLVGEHDFRSFQNRSEPPPVTTVRRIDAVRVLEDGVFLHLEVVGNAFLYNMVRNLAGSLLEVGAGRRDPAWLAQALAACDRREAGPTAPAHGLSLVAVSFDDAELERLAREPGNAPEFRD